MFECANNSSPDLWTASNHLLKNTVVTEHLKKVTVISYKVIRMVGFSSNNAHWLPKCEASLKNNKSHHFKSTIRAFILSFLVCKWKEFALVPHNNKQGESDWERVPTHFQISNGSEFHFYKLWCLFNGQCWEKGTAHGLNNFALQPTEHT